jgi:hypothetical protein
MKKRLYFLLPALAVVLFLACEDTSPGVPCHDIPPGGCPNDQGDPCPDPGCSAAYDCVSGQWKLDHSCNKPDGGAPADGAPEASLGPFDAERSIDAPPGAFGGPGCPDLQMPDCPLGNALECGSGCCGCGDLWVCINGGWNAWGTCSDDAGIHVQAGG